MSPPSATVAVALRIRFALTAHLSERSDQATDGERAQRFSRSVSFLPRRLFPFHCKTANFQLPLPTRMHAGECAYALPVNQDGIQPNLLFYSGRAGHSQHSSQAKRKVSRNTTKIPSGQGSSSQGAILQSNHMISCRSVGARCSSGAPTGIARRDPSNRCGPAVRHRKVAGHPTDQNCIGSTEYFVQEICRIFNLLIYCGIASKAELFSGNLQAPSGEMPHRF